MTLHDAARVGFAAGSATYERGRPEYPEALGGWLAAALGLGPGRVVADVGAGTGRFTARLVATGADVVAVEPVAEMRARIAAAAPGATALDGSAEALPLADASVDALVCAQAFHWFDSPAVLREFHRVLRPGGRLGLVWNVRDESTGWVAELTRVFEPHEGDAPRHRTGRWKAAFEPPRWFTPPRVETFPHRHVGPFERVVVDRVLSVSFVAALPEADRAAVAARVRALPDRHPALRGPEVAFPYLTEAWLAVRVD
ncbi:MAG: class I SAM-dependent methyltransferase [Burkholderiales bacterium]|jgi:SAM-dependent methyltransferase